MTRRLRRNVALRNGSHIVPLFKGDEVPEWAEGVLNEHHITEGDDVEEASAPSDEVPERPPLKGPGSGRAVWEAFATSQGLEVTDDMTKADIISALE